MKEKQKELEQYLWHDTEGVEDIEQHLESSFPLIGQIVMYFNGLEKSLDKILCEIISDRADYKGLIVLHKMAYSTKVDLFKRFCDWFHVAIEDELDGYNDLIQNLKECAKLRNLTIHADWENADIENYTYINLRISKSGMIQEYAQLTEQSLKETVELILKTSIELDEYWQKRNEKLYCID